MVRRESEHTSRRRGMIRFRDFKISGAPPLLSWVVLRSKVSGYLRSPGHIVEGLVGRGTSPTSVPAVSRASCSSDFWPRFPRVGISCRLGLPPCRRVTLVGGSGVERKQTCEAGFDEGLQFSAGDACRSGVLTRQTRGGRRSHRQRADRLTEAGDCAQAG